MARDRPELLPALHHWLGAADEVRQAWSITARGDVMPVVAAASVGGFDVYGARRLAETRTVPKFTIRVVLRKVKCSLTVVAE